MDVVTRDAELVEIRAHRLRRQALVAQRRDGGAAGPLRHLLAVRPEDQPVVEVDRRLGAESAVQRGVQLLVRTMVVAADDVRDPEVNVVDDARKVVGRCAVVAPERQSVEALRQACLPRRLAVTLGSRGRPHRPFVPLDAEPAQVLDDRLLPARDVARGIGVVDPEQHPLAEVARRDRAECVADVQRAGRAGREADARHRASAPVTSRRRAISRRRSSCGTPSIRRSNSFAA